MTAAVVPIGSRRRLANYTGSERCPACDNSAQVIDGTESRLHPTRPAERVSFDIVAPCPFCERGLRFEFGFGRTKEGREYENPDGGPWGKDGYWRGRKPPEQLSLT